MSVYAIRDRVTKEVTIKGPLGLEVAVGVDGKGGGVTIAQDSAAAGAITAKSGLVVLSTAAGERTLADPAAGDNGKRLDIICLAAADGATVVVGSTFGDATNDTVTFEEGEAVSLVAYGGLWYVLAVTAALSAAGP